MGLWPLPLAVGVSDAQSNRNGRKALQRPQRYKNFSSESKVRGASEESWRCPRVLTDLPLFSHLFAIEFSHFLSKVLTAVSRSEGEARTKI